MTTDSGWIVKDKISTKLGSGGNFCSRYEAESPTGQVGFLKAMDLSVALDGDLRNLQALINQYVFEQDILFFCKGRKMSKVVTPLDAGTLEVPNFARPLNQVYYVIFENADGDLRQAHLQNTNKSWLSAFKALHHVAIGGNQLHMAEIAHQDIKPSNILVFKNSGAKISDLGRVTDSAGTSPFTGMQFTGDRSYAPIEVAFGMYPKDFKDRYYADIHMIGSLAYHIVTDVQISTVLLDEVEKILPLGSNYDDALPFLQTAFSSILQRFRTECIILFGEHVADQLTQIVNEMCHPDINKRGSPRFTNRERRLSLNRYVGKFATLVRIATNAGIG